MRPIPEAGTRVADAEGIADEHKESEIHQRTRAFKDVSPAAPQRLNEQCQDRKRNQRAYRSQLLPNVPELPGIRAKKDVLGAPREVLDDRAQGGIVHLFESEI